MTPNKPYLIAVLVTGLFLICPEASFSGETLAKDTRKHSSLKVIVIDAGHGGKDSGAIGPTGVNEKDITLAVAKEIKSHLSKKLKAKILLTRRYDKYLTLNERTNFANKQKADLFISVHVNASLRRKADGIETYFLSFEASDDEARKAAAFENGVITH